MLEQFNATCPNICLLIIIYSSRPLIVRLTGNAVGRKEAKSDARECSFKMPIVSGLELILFVGMKVEN